MLSGLRLLPLVGMAAFLLAAPASSASAAGGSAPSGTIQPGCVHPGDQLTVALTGRGTNEVFLVRITYNDSAGGGGTQSKVGQPNSTGTFDATFRIPTTATAGVGSVDVLSVGAVEAAQSYPANFTVGVGAESCPSPGSVDINLAPFSGQFNYFVHKTCDPGVSGGAIFTLRVTVAYLFSTVGSPQATRVIVGTIDLPSSMNLRLACNGTSLSLPTLPLGSSVLLHEVGLPTGAAASADTTVAYPPTTPTSNVAIHNAKAATAVTPTSRPPVLAQTGQGQPNSPFAPWLVLIAGAGLIAGTLMRFAAKR